MKPATPRSSRWQALLLPSLLAHAGMAVVAAELPLPAETGSATAESVTIHDGVVVGRETEGVRSFKDIPYAAPPTGALRWRKPQAAIAWQQPLDASAFGASCMQAQPPTHVVADSPALRLSEDCLKLNIWSPLNASHAPVMVWIHGGGNTSGTPGDFYMDGRHFAQDGVLLVSVGYRLGVFGFFAHPELSETSEGLANFGLWDQLAALRWVRANIDRFGGDPRNVTLFGESAGGLDVLALMSSPKSNGLFSRAIVESGSGGWAPQANLVSAQKAGAALGTQLQASTLAALRALPASELAVHGNEFGDPVIDGDLLPQALMAAYVRHQVPVLPLIIGTNSLEGSLLGSAEVAPVQIWPALTVQDLAQLRDDYGDEAVDDGAFARVLFRDGFFTGPAQLVARSQHAYLYRFSYVLSALQRRRSGAWHGSEIPYLFKRWPINDLNDVDHRVEAALHDCWVSFARNGRPTCEGSTGWRAFDDGGGEMLFAAQPAVAQAADQKALSLLELRLSPYAQAPQP